ncbi:hypothetical protein CO655_26975 [Rhizobium sp. M1]|nr:hypothetical protein Kim5_PA00033 [Rhizobium sp. Kim5]PDT07441.1 hypothetical protein CO655_26975 [Rhizobium sp. M1]
MARGPHAGSRGVRFDSFQEQGLFTSARIGQSLSVMSLVALIFIQRQNLAGHFRFLAVPIVARDPRDGLVIDISGDDHLPAERRRCCPA